MISSTRSSVGFGFAADGARGGPSRCPGGETVYGNQVDKQVGNSCDVRPFKQKPVETSFTNYLAQKNQNYYQSHHPGALSSKGAADKDIKGLYYSGSLIPGSLGAASTGGGGIVASGPRSSIGGLSATVGAGARAGKAPMAPSYASTNPSRSPQLRPKPGVNTQVLSGKIWNKHSKDATLTKSNNAGPKFNHDDIRSDFTAGSTKPSYFAPHPDGDRLPAQITNGDNQSRPYNQ